jgi:hypothetical protein
MNRLRRFVVAPLLLASVAGLLAYGVHTLVGDGGRVSAFFDNAVYYGLLVAAIALCTLRAVAAPAHRVAWALLAAGVACWTAGDVYWTIALDDVPEPPFPSFADIGYLAYFPLVYAGLFLLLRGRLRASRAVWLDGLTAALAIGTLVAAVLVEAVLDSTGGSTAAVVTNLAYPAGDIVLLALLVGALAIGRTGIGRAPLLLGTALTIGAVADSVYLFQAADGTYSAGTSSTHSGRRRCSVSGSPPGATNGRPRTAPWPHGRFCSCLSPAAPLRWPPWSRRRTTRSARSPWRWPRRRWAPFWCGCMSPCARTASCSSSRAAGR